MFLNSPFIDQIFNYRKIDHIIRLKQTLYDIVFDTEQSHFLTGALAAMLNSRLKVGFATQGRESVYDLGVEYSHGQYEAGTFFRLFAEAIERFPVEIINAALKLIKRKHSAITHKSMSLT